MSQGAQLAIDAGSAETGLVAETQRGTRSGELAWQFGYRSIGGSNRDKEHRCLVVLGDRHRDRIFVYVHRHKSRRFTHSLLLLAGDRSWVYMTSIQRYTPYTEIGGGHFIEGQYKRFNISDIVVCIFM